MNDNSLWQKIEQIFNKAVLLPVGRRNSYIKNACGSNRNLYAEVSSLIDSDEEADDILEDSVFPVVARLLDDDFSELIDKDIASYKVKRLLGRGGMGAVFLAEDSRLERFVALKILPPNLDSNSEIVQRFRQESKAASAISHQNVAHIYEFGQYDGRYFLGMEYVPGKTLRELMKEKQLDFFTAVSITRQIASALKAAHEEDVIHRDVKPENIMLRERALKSKEVLVKVLDFGLAKLGKNNRRSNSHSFDTVPGLIMGTTAYMSPEQVRGLITDKRTDLWSLGVVFYEMLSGIRPFEGETPSDVQAAILLKEPLTLDIEQEIPKVRDIIRKALTKDINMRYQSAEEAEDDLHELQRQAYDYVRRNEKQPSLKIGRGKLSNTKRSFSSQNVNANFNVRQLTFHQGFIQSARFSSKDQTIVYSGAWNASLKLFNLDRNNKESQLAKEEQIDLYGISGRGEIVAGIKRKFLRGYISTGTLSVINPEIGSCHEIIDGIQYADWHPDKERLDSLEDASCWAVVREVNGRSRLEYPIGNVLYETGGWISHPRFSPDGSKIAFICHSTIADDSGTVYLIDLKGKKKSLSDGWVSIQGLAWCPSGKQIWFTATKEGNFRSIYEISLRGKERLIYKTIGSLRLHDISTDGNALVTIDKARVRIAAHTPSASEELDLSWHDWSLVRDFSSDGKTILFTEAGESGGAMYQVFLRKTDGSEALKIGNGSALALSPDGKYALTRLPSSPQQLSILSVFESTSKLLKRPDLDDFYYQPWACWFPNGKKILFSANEHNSGTKLYVQDLKGKPKCITSDYEGIEISSPHSISPDGKLIAVIDAEQRVCLYPTKGGKLEPLNNLNSEFLVVRWSEDGKSLFIRKRGLDSTEIYQYELTTNEKRKIIELAPKDKTGIQEILRVLLTPNGESYAYSYTRELSDLFILEDKHWNYNSTLS